MAVDRSAGIVVIGNEILSGKVTDTNSPFLARELRKLGVTLQRITTIPDEIDLIAATVKEFSERYEIVFTSGGVGPTHDDVTMEGVARAFGRKVVRHPELDKRLREFLGANANPARMRMADVPEGTELVLDQRLGFPTIKCENVYVLPGIPEILEQKFLALKERFVASPYHLRVVFTRDGEGSIAEHLNATLARFPALLLGSYPKLGDPEYAVKLTLESKDQAYVEAALAHLLSLLPKETVVRTE
ncbi:MAG TPA: competence/damage-inducible protein A [Candidatus Eisenbacteria bacterium]|nr:competence/damage-inducible protein A [Candidatus Eisenbacteria bacterium]